MIVCIAEKPSVARDIADVLGARNRKDGYIEGNGYQVTWTFGHLCALKEPHEYTSAWKVWTLGSFSGLKSGQLLILALLSVAGIALSVYNIKDLNAIMLGEQYAKAAGINTKRIKVRIIVASTLLAGGITAFCGPIGFIGIAVPHIARLIYKDADHRVLVPASAILGGGMMLIADTLSQLPGSGSVIPINTMAALLGIPVIFAIIIKNRA